MGFFNWYTCMTCELKFTSKKQLDAHNKAVHGWK